MSGTQNTTQKTSANQASVPHATEATIIFPSKNYIFERDYHPTSTDYRVTTEEVNEILDLTERTLKDRLCCYNCIVYVWVLFFLLMLFWLSEGKSLGLSSVNLIWILLIVVWGYLLTLYRQRKTEQARKVIQQRLDLHNQRLAGVGVRWHIPKAFPLWIELHNDFKSQAIPQSNPFDTSNQPNTFANYNSNAYYPPPQQYNQTQGPY